MREQLQAEQQVKGDCLPKGHQSRLPVEAYTLKTASFFRDDSGKMKTNWLREKKRKLTILDVDSRLERALTREKKKGRKLELQKAQLKNNANGLEQAVRERANQVQNLEAEKEELWEEQKTIIVVWSLTMQQRAMFRNVFYQAHRNFMCCQYQLDEFLDRLSDVKDKFLDLGRGINGLIDAWDKSEDSWKDALARMRKGVAVARELNKHVEKVYGEAYPTGPVGQKLVNCLQNVISCLDFFIGLFDNDKAIMVY
ncbi:hypothetical protein CCACVL1_17827 [Corchorus capsularis]|uniref:Uncharacterized protein n=1 Tax=Corchorus capsularis TaxID=210143 RepID=A0A1R3HPZ6_COCAP|nr:hypothetical protein CCACVL1_17827 [Corchorus capsularis]